MGAGGKSGSGHYPGWSTYGGDYQPRAFGSGGVSGQWTHGGDVESGAGGTSGSGHYPGGRPMEGTTHLEHSVLVGSLDSGLMAGISRLEPLEQSVLNMLLVARPGEGITEMISDWEPVAHPVPDTSLDGRRMEGTTNLEHSVLVGSLDSGLMEGMSRLEPLEQSVLNTLLFAQPVDVVTETDTPERSALA